MRSASHFPVKILQNTLTTFPFASHACFDKKLIDICVIIASSCSSSKLLRFSLNLSPVSTHAVNATRATTKQTTQFELLKMGQNYMGSRAGPQNEKWSDRQITENPTGSIHKEARKKSLTQKKLILIRGFAFEKYGPCSKNAQRK